MGIGYGKCSKWLQQRTNLEKTLISTSILLFLTCFIIIIFGIAYKGNSPEEKFEEPICMSKECIQTAGDMIGMADFTADPCHDFYDFACGRFVRTHAIPLDHQEASVEHDSSDALRIQLKNWLETSTSSNNASSYRKARILYSTCMDFDVPVPLFHSIVQKVMSDEKIGNWPVLDPMWDETDVSLEQRLASLTLLGVPVAFQLQIVPDSRNPNKYIPRISPGQPLLFMYEPDEVRDDPMLRSYMESALVMLGVPRNRVSREVDDMLSTETYFIRIKKKAEEECGNEQDNGLNDLISVRVPLHELDRMMPEVNWTQIMLTIYSVLDTTQEFTVELHCRRYIREYTDFLEQASPKTVYNYLGWRFLFAFIAHLGRPFQKLRSDYEDHVSMDHSTRLFQPRWKDCVSMVEQHMLPVVATLYAQHEMTKNVVELQTKLASRVKSSLESLLSTCKWLENNEKQRIKQKVAKVKFEDALANFSDNVDRINSWFSKLDLHSDHLMHNIMRIQRFMVTQQLQKLTSPPDKDMEWHNLSFGTPAHLQYYGNVIAVPYDKIREPYLRLHQPSYLNYGGYVAFLAHELIYYISTFGLSGAQSGERSDLLDLIENRRNISSCLMNQIVHSIAEDREVLTLDGPSWFKETLMDLGSIQVSHMSYERNRGEDKKLPGMDLGQEKMFFLSYAQAFCEVRDDRSYRNPSNITSLPSRIRINSALRNFPKFAEVYGCQSNTPMNPTKKCPLW